jgi:hypothetical protein
VTDYRRSAAIFATHHAKPMGINSLTRNYIPELKICTIKFNNISANVLATDLLITQ